MPAQVERLQAEHLAGARKHSKILFSLLMFQLWQGSESRRGQSRQAAVTFAA